MEPIAVMPSQCSCAFVVYPDIAAIGVRDFFSDGEADHAAKSPE